MTFSIVVKLATIGFFAVTLIGCGGGGTSADGGTNSIVSPTFQNAAAAQTVTVFRADGNSAKITVSTETFDSLNIATEQTYSGLLSNGDVAGIETIVANIPTSGTFSYTGSSVAIINDGSYLYELEGTSRATLTLSESSSDLNVTLSEFSGSRTDTTNATKTPINKSEISIMWQDVELIGSELGGGTVNVIGAAATISGGANIDVAGSIFGNAGEELGGLISVNDPDNLEVTAGFIGKQ